MIKLQGQSRLIAKGETLKVVREGCVKFIDGKPVKSDISEIFVVGNVQPVQGRDLLLVPEGDRFKENFYVWTADKLLVNDRVVRNGSNYQVQQVETWGSYLKIRMTRVDVGPNATP